MECGHPEARRYPLGMVWDESNIIIERRNRQTITETTLMQHVVSSVLSGREGNKGLQRVIGSINLKTVPHSPAGPEQGQVNGEAGR